MTPPAAAWRPPSPSRADRPPAASTRSSLTLPDTRRRLYARTRARSVRVRRGSASTGFCRVPRTQIAQTGRVLRAVGNHLVGHLRHHDLPAVSGRSQPGTPVYLGFPIGPVVARLRLTRMQRHADPQLAPIGPSDSSQRTLDVDGSKPTAATTRPRSWRPSHPARTASVPGIRAGPGARVDLQHQPRHPLQRRQPAPPPERSASISAGSTPRSPRPARRSRRPVRRPRRIAGRANRSRSSSDPAVPTPCQRRSAHMGIRDVPHRAL
jgi:hypothetical protein